jgi:glucose/arabinose dehydrogenase
MKRAPLLPLLLFVIPAAAESVRTGVATFGDWRTDAPGVRRVITPADLPPPFATQSATDGPPIVRPPANARPQVPAGFAAEPWVSGLNMPRVIRTAPNGDIFLAESGADRVRVFRTADGAARPTQTAVFAEDLPQPFGIAFWPPGPQPRYAYVALAERVVRFAYRNGDMAARGPAETMIARLPEGGHWTRDLAVAPDGSRLFLSVGSADNAGESMPSQPPKDSAAWQAEHGMGAAWGENEGRGAVLHFAPEGDALLPFANGLRNCSGMTVQPATGALWCVTNERDGMGDNLPPDFATRVVEGGFYGWPWFYIGNHEDPRPPGRRPDLASHVTIPDVLIQPHSSPLGVTFYDPPPGAAAFPDEYRGDAFVALHGSWNRAKRTGYKVVRLRMRNGRPTGEYDDFLTGFVLSDRAVWGRPVDVAVAHDGSLLVTEDGNGTIWRVTYHR